MPRPPHEYWENEPPDSPPPPPHHHPHHPPPPPRHRGYWAAFPTEDALTLLEQLFGDRDQARAAERILRDCPPEIALVVEVVVRVWGGRVGSSTSEESK